MEGDRQVVAKTENVEFRKCENRESRIAFDIGYRRLLTICKGYQGKATDTQDIISGKQILQQQLLVALGRLGDLVHFSLVDDCVISKAPEYKPRDALRASHEPLLE